MVERVYRSMRTASDGLPATGPTARALGVRPDIDILLDDDGMVMGGGGGMSVAPDSPMHLPAHRRPPECGGTGKDPVWELDVTDLGSELAYREDPLLPGEHGFIEPARRMAFDAYQDALLRTRGGLATTISRPWRSLTSFRLRWHPTTASVVSGARPSTSCRPERRVSG